MGRPLRAAAGGIIYHVLNRANGRRPLFEKPADYEAFEKVLSEAHERVAMRTLAYCVMPNHWHLVLWPRRDDDLSRFMAWVTLTHTHRWHAYRQSAGRVALNLSRCRQTSIFLTVCRYVERNALRAQLVDRAEGWRWSSVGRREQGRALATAWLTDWPVARPRRWVQ